MRQLYFDHNSTTPIAPSVQEAILPFLAHFYGNPSSSHPLGIASREAVEDARGQTASLLGCDVDEVIFTSGATEANNLALKGVMGRHSRATGGHLVISAIEHASVRATAEYLERQGFDVSIVPCTDQGVIPPEQVRSALRNDTILVSVMHASNETGVIQPIRAIAEICHERGVLLHTDATQTVGKIRTLVDELEVDLLTLSGHKAYAPKGIGALYVRRGVQIEPIMHGCGHEAGLRSGTENLVGIVGLGRALSLASKSLDPAAERMTLLRDKLISELRAGIPEPIVVFGELATRLPNTLYVSFPSVVGLDMLRMIPELQASTGSAAYSDTNSISHTLEAMGVAADVARGSIRLGVGWYTSEEDVERCASLLIHAWETLR
ncbi:aminotransferase class V [Pirellula staleyi DSM 6068]|uniref:cysteine desulfurase n=1 Tax=Pirellula staleyi (strain ATCC 27377 / DSM 6068 / ICPB 4128) TaxID=530564 RepID=D2QYB3_PIRSD|nr:cysteine desulfurase family protein [Pirellula staleyi]ADB16327.1 aminotransferase class V [Pirellula staleyi DSM 6068]